MQSDELAAVVVTTMKAAVAPLQAKHAVLEATLEALAGQLEAKLARLTGALEALEARPPVPGPPGPPGPPGVDGAAGAPGKAGLVSKGDFDAGAAYEAGDLVRCRRAIWICQEATTGRWPGDGSPAWKLWLKANDGRDGKDLR